MKIFEKREYQDGGPNDRGQCIGYIKAETLDKAKRILNVNHGFIQLYEISDTEYNKRKSMAKAAYNIFK